MTRNLLLYIKDILQNMQDAEDFIRGMSFANFDDLVKSRKAMAS